jgi:transposase-like protein
MASVPIHNSAWLLRVAKEVARQLKTQSLGTALRVRAPAKIEVTGTDTRGWAAVVGRLGKGGPGVEVWLDRFSGHAVRKLYVCFYSRDAKQVRSVARKASRQLWPIRTITDSDVDETNGYVLKKPLPRDEFNAPIEEHYNKYRHHFFGFYDPTPESSAGISAQFVERAVGFLVDVARSEPDATEADSQTDVYPRCENRKLVKAHLGRERSGYLAAECKNRDRYRCQICDFNFAEHYGRRLGAGFAEAHHIRPLSKLGDRVRTNPEDLITVCPNCHRMLHRMDGTSANITKLKTIVRKYRL